jgi:uncharacterized membrane protein
LGKIRALFRKVEAFMEQLSDYAAAFSAHPAFLVLHILWFIFWVADDIEEFPYGLLTMIVSLEAILLSSLILSSTSREAERDRQTLIRNANQAKETHEMLDDLHDDVHEIIEILEEKPRDF